MGSEHRFYKPCLSAHIILVCCVIFNFPCCNDAGVMELGHICELRGKQSWDQFYNHCPENQTHHILLDLLPSHELLSTSITPGSTSPAPSLLTKWKGKFLQGQCEPSQWLLLQPHSCAHPPAALQGITLCWAVPISWQP